MAIGTGEQALAADVNALITDHVAEADPHPGYVLESLFDAYSIIYADTDDTPARLTVGASTLVGRAAAGGIAALTVDQVVALLLGKLHSIGTFTNRTTNGTKAITGVNFQPRYIIVCGGSAALSIAHFDGTRQVGTVNNVISATITMQAYTDASNRITGTLTSLDADGFTTTWSDLQGTAPERTYFYIAFR